MMMKKGVLNLFQNICMNAMFHLFAGFLVFIYVLTSVRIFYLQQMWSTNDDTSYQMSSVTNKISYSIRSLLLLSHLQ